MRGRREPHPTLGRAIADVARELDLSVNSVYVAKHRVLARIQELRDNFDSLKDKLVPGNKKPAAKKKAPVRKKAPAKKKAAAKPKARKAAPAEAAA